MQQSTVASTSTSSLLSNPRNPKMHSVLNILVLKNLSSITIYILETRSVLSSSALESQLRANRSSPKKHSGRPAIVSLRPRKTCSSSSKRRISKFGLLLEKQPTLSLCSLWMHHSWSPRASKDESVSAEDIDGTRSVGWTWVVDNTCLLAQRVETALRSQIRDLVISNVRTWDC